MVDYKLGKTPARPGATSFKLTAYLPLLPTAPKVFGHQGKIRAYGMLGNDSYGDCVWAGAGHETMLWNRLGGNTVKFKDSNVLADYSTVTGFNPDDPNSDQGTDMQVAASYRRKVGVVDSKGLRHKIAAYIAITPGNLKEVDAGAYLFGAIGVGINFPGSAMDQFNDGKPWDVVHGAQIEGGHYVPLVGRRRNGNYVVVTWGKLQEVTPRFLTQYMDEGLAYLSQEVLLNGKSLEGFSFAQLQADLNSLH